MFILLLTVAVEKDDTIIQREHRLQDRTDKIGGDRNGRQEGVGTHIEHNSQSGSNKDHNGFEPGLRHNKEHQHDHHRSDDNHGNRRCGAVLTGLYDAVAAESCTDLLAQRFLVNRFRHIQIEDCMGAIRRIPE